MVDPWQNGRKGIDILADILRHVDAITTRNIMRNLQRVEPRIVDELKRRILTFEDLAKGDPRGLAKLTKIVHVRDLARALKGAPQEVLEKLALQMSRNAIEDLRDEISLLGPSPIGEVEAARGRILEGARNLIDKRELYIQKSADDWIS